MASFFDRLKERKLFQWALAYAAGAWVLFEVSDAVGGRWQLPNVFFQGLSVVLVVGFFVTLVLAWYHGEKGRQRVSGMELVLVAALLTIGAGAVGLLPVTDGPEAEAEPQALLPEPTDDRPSLAVLPFASLSQLPENADFTDGVWAQVQNQLSRIAALRVISRTSAAGYRDTPKNSRLIGEELTADYLLTADVQRAGNRILITLQLTDVLSDTQVWGEDFEEEYSVANLFEIQRRIALGIVTALSAVLTSEEEARIAALPTDDEEAFEYYLQGTVLMSQCELRFPCAEISEAAHRFQNALRIDPNFAMAWAGLSQSLTIANTGAAGLRSEEEISTAKAAVDRALELAPDLPEAALALGIYYRFGFGQNELAVAQFKRTLERHPNDPATRFWLGLSQRSGGEWTSAMKNLRWVADHDPRSVEAQLAVAQTYLLMRRYELAERFFDRVVSLGDVSAATIRRRALIPILKEGDVEAARGVLATVPPDIYDDAVLWWDYYNELRPLVCGECRDLLERRLLQLERPAVPDWHYHQSRARLSGLLGDAQEKQIQSDSAAMILGAAVQEDPENPHLHWDLSEVSVQMGRETAAIEEAMETVRLTLNDHTNAWRYVLNLALVYTIFDEPEAAIDQLESALAVPSEISVPLLRLHPNWDPLRDYPRFQALLEKYGSEP
jgi:TolB-like protein/thioredoxin-like negative regulator of GroEL